MRARTRALFGVLLATVLAACPQPSNLSSQQGPSLAEVKEANGSAIHLFGSGGQGVPLLIRSGYDSNQNAQLDPNEPPLAGWGMRVTREDSAGKALEASEVMVMPPANGQRWQGVLVNVPPGRYLIESLTPKTLAGAAWKATRGASETVDLTDTTSVRVLEFGNVCSQNGSAVMANAVMSTCKPEFDLAPRISSFTIAPSEIRSGEQAQFSWEVLDNATLEIDEGVGSLEGVKGAKDVAVFDTAQYTLTARNAFGSSQVRAVATVLQKSTSGTFAKGGRLPFPDLAFYEKLSLSNGKIVFLYRRGSENAPIQARGRYYIFDPKSKSFSSINVPKEIPTMSVYNTVILDDAKVLVSTSNQFDETRNIEDIVFDFNTGMIRKSNLRNEECDYFLPLKSAKALCFYTKPAPRALYLDYLKNTVIATYDYPDGPWNLMDTSAHTKKFLVKEKYLVAFTGYFLQVFDVINNQYILQNIKLSNRFEAAITDLGNNKILFSGGVDNYRSWKLINEPPEILNLSTGAIEKVGRMNVNRFEAKTFVLPNSDVLFLGGYIPFATTDWMAFPPELFHQDTRQFTLTDTFREPRYGYDAVQLQDGRVMVLGGYDKDGNPVSSIEIYNP